MPSAKMAAPLLHRLCLKHRQLPAIDFIDLGQLPNLFALKCDGAAIGLHALFPPVPRAHWAAAEDRAF